MLAMVVNDDAGHLTPLGVLRFIASMLAPTGGVRRHHCDQASGWRTVRRLRRPGNGKPGDQTPVTDFTVTGKG